MPGDDGSSGAVGDQARPVLIPQGRAHRHPGLRVPRLGARRAVDPLGVDVVLAVARVLPREDRAAAAVGGDDRHELVQGRRAHGRGSGPPLERSVGVHPLGVDVEVEVTQLLPHHHRAPGAVRDDRGDHLVAHRAGERDAVGRPDPRPGPVHALRVNVEQEIAIVVPGDDRPARPIARRHRVALVLERRADRHAVLRPLDLPARIHSLAVDVDERVTAQVAIVGPGDDRPAGAICGDRGSYLLVRAAAHGDPVGRPLRPAVRVEALGVDVGSGGAGAVVLPRHDRPAGPVGGDHRELLVPGRRAQRHAARGPHRRPRLVHALRVDIKCIGAAARVHPDDDRPSASVRARHRTELVVGRGTDGPPVGRPLSMGREGERAGPQRCEKEKKASEVSRHHGFLRAREGIKERPKRRVPSRKRHASAW